MIGNWGRWGANDELGAANLITPDVVRHAMLLVSTGEVVALAQPLGPDTPAAPHRRSPVRFMDRDAGDYALGARSPDGFRFSEDTIQLAAHSGTHVDALAHVWSGDVLYNGHPASSIRSTRGAQYCGAEKLRPMLTRGVLIDVAGSRGGRLEASSPIDAEELQQCVRDSGVELQPGDAVLIRTGWWEQRQYQPHYFEDEPGLSVAAAQWLASQDVSLVGADNYTVEVQPSPLGATFPVHLKLLFEHGVLLLENLNLAELVSYGRTTFLFVSAPLPFVGSTAGLVAPLVVL